MPKTKVEVYDKDHLIYPFIESDHVTFSNGMKVSEMLDQSISMPTVIHEDLSFKVGVGDQDVSSAIVDSSVAEMTIKGQTYQNILLEPSTHVLTNNKEMFKVNEGLDPNVEIVDGVSKSAILKGQTLVNLFRIGNNRSNGGSICGYKDGMIQFVFGEGWDYSYTSGINCLGDCLPLSKGKKYFYRLELSRTPAKYVTINSHNTDSHFAFKTYAQIDTINSQQTIFTGVFEADSNNRVGVQIKDVNGGETMTGTFLVVEYQNGMENWNIPYFEGMQSVKMPVLTTTGKNLFDIKEDTINWNGANIKSNSDNTVTFSPNSDNSAGLNGTFKFVEPIRFKVGTQFTYSFKRVNGGNSDFQGAINARLRVLKKDGSYTTLFIGDLTSSYFDKVISKTYTFTEDFDSIVSIEPIMYSVRNLTSPIIMQFQLEEGSSTTTYEPYKSNILTVNEEVELRGIGEVKDELNLITGELTERIGEVVLDGSEDERWVIFDDYSVENNETIAFSLPKTFVEFKVNPSTMMSDKYIFYGTSYGRTDECLAINPHDTHHLQLRILKTKASTVTELKTYLHSNPIKVQGILETQSVKTVDLSSSGNWEKVVLDGRQGFTWQGSVNAFYVRENRLKKLQNYSQAIISDTGSVVNNYGSFVDGCNEVQITGYPDTQNKYPNENWLYFRIPNIESDVNALKQYLSQNPITVWFQTETHQGSTQVKQPIFFKDGHIIQSSGINNSLIPTLDYQAKTSNSYVMDLMKANTRYTMKAKSASGTFTIDGTSYEAETNGTFTTPSSMTNKLLVMSNKTNEEVMILEGDVVSKTVPYFKGIKSAFEGEDKIEVLSTGKNLFDVNLIYGAHTYGNIGQKPTHGTGYARVTNETGDYILVKPNTKYTFSIENNFSFAIAQLDKDGISLGDTGWLNNKSSWTITTKSTARYVGFNIRKLDDSDITPDEVYKAYPMFEESLSATTYEPYKSNNTKIPLLSALRSLPNGVYDELIIDRMKNKATLIKRLDCITFDGSSDENWHTWGSANSPSHLNNYHYVDGTNNTKNLKVKVDPSWIVSRLGYGGGYKSEKTGARLNSDYFAFSIPKNSIGAGSGDINSMYEKSGRAWLSQNPITVYYELETPVITEIDLEGFPYIYKDGHIFLNSEIVPTTEITYSINQCQQISASNEDIIRHEKELTYLQKLIAQYVQVDYESALLSLKV